MIWYPCKTISPYPVEFLKSGCIQQVDYDKLHCRLLPVLGCWISDIVFIFLLSYVSLSKVSPDFKGTCLNLSKLANIFPFRVFLFYRWIKKSNIYSYCFNYISFFNVIFYSSVFRLYTCVGYYTLVANSFWTIFCFLW